MRLKLLFSSYRPRLKCAAAAGAAGAAGFGYQAAGDLLNMIGTAVLQRNAADLQQETQRKQNAWTEDMYNKYQSPQALMRQYREAGINPLLQSQGSGLTGQMPSSGSASAPSASMTPSPFGQVMAQQEYNAIVSGNQRSQSILNGVRAINEAFINGGYNAGVSMIQQLMPEFRINGMDEHQVSLMTASIKDSAAAKASIDKIDADWQKEYGKDLRSTELMKLNQDINEVVGRLNVMQSQADVNRAQAQELGSRIARNIAEAFKLHKEGDYYDVSADTARKIQQYVIAQMILSNGQLGIEFERLGVQYGNEIAAAELKRAISSNPYLQYTQWALESLGNVVHVGLGFNFGSSKSMVKSYSDIHSDARSSVNVNSQGTSNVNYNNVTPQTPHVPVSGFGH